MTSRLNGSDTTSACSVSAWTCSLISRLSSGSPPICTLAGDLALQLAQPGGRRRRSRRPARRRRSSGPGRPRRRRRGRRWRPGRRARPAYGSTTRPTCGTRATSAAAASDPRPHRRVGDRHVVDQAEGGCLEPRTWRCRRSRRTPGPTRAGRWPGWSPAPRTPARWPPHRRRPAGPTPPAPATGAARRTARSPRTHPQHPGRARPARPGHTVLAEPSAAGRGTVVARRYRRAVTLFDEAADAAGRNVAPLAVRMRPRTLDELVGQTHLLGPGSPLRRLVEGDTPLSVIMWGPRAPGRRRSRPRLARHHAAATCSCRHCPQG